MYLLNLTTDKQPVDRPSTVGNMARIEILEQIFRLSHSLDITPTFDRDHINVNHRGASDIGRSGLAAYELT